MSGQKTLIIREAILRALADVSPASLPANTIRDYVAATGLSVGSDTLAGHLSYLELHGYVQRHKETLCPALARFTVSETGIACLDSDTWTQPLSDETDHVSNKTHQKSLILGAIAKATKAFYAFFVWLFTEII